MAYIDREKLFSELPEFSRREQLALMSIGLKRPVDTELFTVVELIVALRYSSPRLTTGEFEHTMETLFSIERSTDSST